MPSSLTPAIGMSAVAPPPGTTKQAAESLPQDFAALLDTQPQSNRSAGREMRRQILAADGRKLPAPLPADDAIDASADCEAEAEGLWSALPSRSRTGDEAAIMPVALIIPFTLRPFHQPIVAQQVVPPPGLLAARSAAGDTARAPAGDDVAATVVADIASPGALSPVVSDPVTAKPPLSVRPLVADRARIAAGTSFAKAAALSRVGEQETTQTPAPASASVAERLGVSEETLPVQAAAALRHAAAERGGLLDGSVTPAPVPVRPAGIAGAVAAATNLDGTQHSRPDGNGAHRMIDQIAHLRDAVESDGAALRDDRIVLTPEALGRIEVAVQRAADGVQVRFLADEQNTRHLLAEHQPRLVELANERGVRLDRATVAGGSQDDRGHRHPGSARSGGPKRPASAVAAARGEPSTLTIRLA